MNKQIEQVKEFNKGLIAQTTKQKAGYLDSELDEYWGGVQLCVHSHEKNNPAGALMKAYTEVFDGLLDCKYVLYGILIQEGLEPVPNRYVNLSYNYDNTQDLRTMYDRITLAIKECNWLEIDDLLNYLLSQHGMMDLFEVGFTEVHLSNLSKFDNNGKGVYDKNNKLQKNMDTYFKPNLKDILFKTETI